MSQNMWTAVDDYFVETLLGDDVVLRATLQANIVAGLPPIDVAPNQGKLLNLLAKSCGARRILEIGTLGGYSTVWLARALPVGGQLVTLELDPVHANVARKNFERAKLTGVVELREGPALESLAQLAKERIEAFDFIFIDADKPNNPGYLEGIMRLSRVGTVIVADNVVREGAVADASSSDPKVQGSRRVLEMMGRDPRLEATALQTVGSKGYDGFAIARVKELN